MKWATGRLRQSPMMRDMCFRRGGVGSSDYRMVRLFVLTDQFVLSNKYRVTVGFADRVG